MHRHTEKIFFFFFLPSSSWLPSLFSICTAPTYFFSWTFRTSFSLPRKTQPSLKIKTFTVIQICKLWSNQHTYKREHFLSQQLRKRQRQSCFYSVLWQHAVVWILWWHLATWGALKIKIWYVTQMVGLRCIQRRDLAITRESNVETCSKKNAGQNLRSSNDMKNLQHKCKVDKYPQQFWQQSFEYSWTGPLLTRTGGKSL